MLRAPSPARPTMRTDGGGAAVRARSGTRAAPSPAADEGEHGGELHAGVAAGEGGARGGAEPVEDAGGGGVRRPFDPGTLGQVGQRVRSRPAGGDGEAVGVVEEPVDRSTFVLVGRSKGVVLGEGEVDLAGVQGGHHRVVVELDHARLDPLVRGGESGESGYHQPVDRGRERGEGDRSVHRAGRGHDVRVDVLQHLGEPGGVAGEPETGRGQPD